MAGAGPRRTGSRIPTRPYIVASARRPAIPAAAFAVLLALFLTWGLSEEAQAGARWKGNVALVFLASTAANVYAVNRVLDGGASAWLLVTALPPLTMLALLVFDRDALWGNFRPSPPLRVVQRVAAVGVFALPGLLAWAAS